MICDNNTKKDFPANHIYPITSELSRIWITGDGTKFIDKDIAEAYQEFLLEKNKIKLTVDEMKERILHWVRYGDDEDVQEWIFQFIDMYNEATCIMQTWNDNKMKDEYNALVLSYENQL